MKKKVCIVLCILVAIIILETFGSMIFQNNANPLLRIVSKQKSSNSISEFRLFRNILTGTMYLDVRADSGATSRTKLVDKEGNSIIWKFGVDYKNRFMVVFALEADEDGDIYQTLVDKETNVVYHFYLTRGKDYKVELVSSGDQPQLWEGELIP